MAKASLLFCYAVVGRKGSFLFSLEAMVCLVTPEPTSLGGPFLVSYPSRLFELYYDKLWSFLAMPVGNVDTLFPIEFLLTLILFWPPYLL